MSASPEELDAQDQRGLFSYARQDFLASIVVFLVALPLCMGISIASGVPVSAGLITGIIGGIIVGALSGAPLQVSGPAAGLTVIVLEIVLRDGIETLGMAVLIGGILQIIAGVFKLGQWFRAVSPAVVQGMLAGIGVLIFASQFHVMVDDKPKENGIQNLITIPQAITKVFPIPEWKDRSIRKEKTRLLKEFGKLHEEQEQIHEDVAAHVSERTADLENLAESKERQNALDERLHKLIASIEIEQSERLQQAIQKADAAIHHARDLLEVDESAEFGATELEAIRESQEEAEKAMRAVLGAVKNHTFAAGIGLLTILILIAWQTIIPKSIRMVPGPLVAIVVATAVSAIFVLPVLYVEVPDNLWSEIHVPTLTTLQAAPLGDLLMMGVVIAIVASAETLLCATAVDQMQTGPRTNYDKELTAQGIGNSICGMLGALPMTGVIVRSAANVQSGGKTRLSAILHGIWLLIFVSFLAFLLRMIPTSGLAAMLVYIGYKLINPQGIKKLAKIGKSELFIFAVTVITIVVEDLLVGVMVGVAVSAFRLLLQFSHLGTTLDIDKENKKAVLTLDGSATFIRLPYLADELDNVPKGYELHVDMDGLNHIDHACLNLISDFAKRHEQFGGTLHLDWNDIDMRFDGTLPGKDA